MTIDWTQPIETEDGRPAKISHMYPKPARVVAVSTVGHPAKHARNKPSVSHVDKQSFTYNYYKDSGAFFGDPRRENFYGVRNVDLAHTFVPENWE